MFPHTRCLHLCCVASINKEKIQFNFLKTYWKPKTCGYAKCLRGVLFNAWVFEFSGPMAPTNSDSWNSCHGDITVLLVVTVGLMVVSRVIGITVLHRALRDNGTYIRMCFVFLLCPTMSHSKIILTSVGRWSRKRCEKAVGRSIYYRLSYNYILIEATGISEEGFPRTCVFIISRNKSSPYVRIKNKDDTAFAHIVVKKACGSWVPRYVVSLFPRISIVTSRFY